MIPYIIGALVIAGVLIALTVQHRIGWLRRIASGLLISYVTVLLVFTAGELFLRCCYADSAGQLTSDNWLERYWDPNSLGFRDREWTEADFNAETTIAVIGDSFTAGWGIEDTADRFPRVLANRLGEDYAIFNLGQWGTSTPRQLENLKTFVDQAVTPDVVILQYFLNDIDHAVLSLGLPIPEDTPPEITRTFHLVDFIYTRLSNSFTRDYWREEYAHYDNYVIWDTHEAELNELIDYVDSIDARLIVVIFPNMLDPVRSIAYVDRVAHVFEARGHNEILKLFDAAAAWTPETRMISPRDAHASAAFHEYVGDALYEQFFAP